ncbi:MAG: hypothetical protein ACOCRO_02345 [Halanaerobiales bacterium]
MDIYIGTCNNPDETKAIAEVQPEHVFVSYYYFQNKNLRDFVKELGYKPKIILDCGAFSSGKNSRKRINYYGYIDYVKKNYDYIHRFISYDYISQPQDGKWQDYFAELTGVRYYSMKDYGLYNQIPVFHIGEPIEWLEIYYDMFLTDYICLGSTVGIKSKKFIKNWVNVITEKYPWMDYHLLGSTSDHIIYGCPRLTSCDSTTWTYAARFGDKNKRYEKLVHSLKKTLGLIEKETNKISLWEGMI